MRNSTQKRAVFLDRDGTLNYDPGYIKKPSELILLPGVPEGLQQLAAQGYELIVVSNQSGIGRGLFSVKDLDAIHTYFNDLLRPHAIQIRSFEYCPHKPEDRCSCRKPSPKLIQDVARRYSIDVSKSFMVGDRYRDLLSGSRAGCRGLVWMMPQKGAHYTDDPEDPDFVNTQKLANFKAANFGEVAKYICGLV